MKISLPKSPRPHACAQRTPSGVSSMRKLLMLAGLVACQLPLAHAADYYVDSTSTGTNFGSRTNPWKSLAWNAPINQTAFQPGDRIFFRKGRTYVGQIMPLGSGGTAAAPVIFDSYEEPGDPQTKPVIAGMGTAQIGSTIYLKDKSYVTVQNLEVTNWPAGATATDGSAGVRDGIRIQIYGAGVKSGIKILNNTIRQVRGITARGGLYGNAAIYVITSDSSTNARWDDVLIEGNDISDSTCIGIYVKCPPYYTMANTAGWATNVKITGNTFQNMGADHIVLNGCESPVVEFNKGYGAGVYGTRQYEMIAGMWTCYKTQNTLFQYNEVAYTENEFANGLKGDSQAFDVDYGTQGNHVFQYNYTHHNEGGVLIIMPADNNGAGTNYPKTTIYRYNLSVNDGRNTGTCSQFSIFPVQGTSSAHIHNNVFYSTLPEGYRFTGVTAAYYSNNVFHVPRAVYPSASRFSNNCYFGHEVEVNDPFKVVADPKFVSPFPAGAGGDGDIAASTDIFKLQATSPLINAGKVVMIDGSPSVAPNGDYWANPLNQGLPDIGAHEHPSGATLPAAATATATTVYEDNSPAVTYSHTTYDPNYWTYTTTDGTSSGNSQHVSYVPGKWVEVTFTGSHISLYGKKSPSGGQMSVIVDGTPVSDIVDFYWPVDMFRTELYRITGLNPTQTHTIRFTVMTTKNVFSANKYVYIDYFEQLPVAPPAAPKVTLLDNSTATYAGTWTQATADNQSYGKTYASSTAQNSYVEFTFTGTGVRLYGQRAVDHGKMTVTINGVNPVQIDNYAPVTAYAYIDHRAKLFEKKGLPPGTYVVRATVDSNDGKKIALDWAEGLVETAPVNIDTNGSTPSLVYTGTWTHSADAAYYNGTKSVASANNASVEFTFTGTAVKLFGKKAANLNKLNISVNNGTPVLVDCTSATTLVPTELFGITGLAPGVNKIKATIYDPANSGKTVGIDYFQYQP